MANVTASIWTAALDGTDSTAYTTASLTGIPTGSPTFLYVTCTGGTALVAPTVVTTGLTWVLVGSYTVSATMVFLYVCCDTAGTALGTTAISWGADVKTGCGWIVFTTANARIGNNGQDAVGTPVTQAGTVAAPSVTLATLAGADSLAVGILRHGSNSAPSVGAGFGTISGVAGSNPSAYILAEGKLNTTTVDFSGVLSTERLIGFEIKAETITAKSVSETGTGTDSSTLTAALSTSQTATGTDAATLTTALSTAESATGADSATLTAALTASQTVTGTDAVALAAALSTSEVGAGADSASLTATGLTSESGSGTDNAALVVTLTTSEVATTTDAASLDVALVTSEVGAGLDAASLGVQDRFVADTASSAEAATLVASLTVSDVGVGVDAGSAAATFSVSDLGAGTETVSMVAALAAFETATSQQLAQLVATLAVSDAIHVDDAATGGPPSVPGIVVVSDGPGHGVAVGDRPGARVGLGDRQGPMVSVTDGLSSAP